MAKILAKSQIGISEKDCVHLYLEEITGSNPLTAAEEVILAKKIREGDQRAREELILANLRFVVRVAGEYQGQGLSMGDLINIGNVGLVTSVDRFDGTRGFKFISYAVWWIRQAIRIALSEQSRAVRIPVNRIGKLNKIIRAKKDLEQKFGRNPSSEEIASEIDESDFHVRDMLRILNRPFSLDAPFKKGDDGNLLDVLEDDRQAPPDKEVFDKELGREIEKVLVDLTPREAEVVCLYFGYKQDKPLTLEEIGKRFNLTRERIRKIRDMALHRLRHNKRSGTLRSLMESWA